MRKKTEKQMAEWEKKRNIGDEILQGIRDIKAGRVGRRYSVQEGLKKKGADSASLPVTDSEVLSVWDDHVDHKEQPDDIARQLRRGNNRRG